MRLVDTSAWIEWLLDSPTGQLYYKAASGQNPNNLDIELPKTQALVQVSGSYSSPVSGLRSQC